MMARGMAVIRKITLQFIRNIHIIARIIWPRAQPIDKAIGEAVRITFDETSEIDSKDAL